jgi:chromosome partitioning protein
MPTISFASSKGGAGKSTSAVLLATELAQRGTTVTIIDADPNQPVLRWSRKPGKPASLTVIGGATEETLIDVIDAAARKTAFVIVDLEGTASVMVAHAMTRSDLVIIPTKGSELDGIEAAKVIQFIRRQERAYSRKIPFAVLFTQTNPAVRPRTLKSLEADMLGDVQFPEVLIEIDGLTRFSWIRRRPRSAARCRTRTGNSVTTALSDYSPRLALRLRPFAHHGLSATARLTSLLPSRDRSWCLKVRADEQFSQKRVQKTGSPPSLGFHSLRTCSSTDWPLSAAADPPRALDGARHRSQMKIVVNQAGGWLIA